MRSTIPNWISVPLVLNMARVHATLKTSNFTMAFISRFKISVSYVKKKSYIVNLLEADIEYL